MSSFASQFYLLALLKLSNMLFGFVFFSWDNDNHNITIE